MLNRVFAAGCILAGSVLLSACQSGDAGGGGLGLGGRSAEPAPDAIRESELRAYCPSLSVREGGAFHVVYEGNAEGDPDRILFQASISDRTRTCRYGEGAGWVTVAIAGRVVPGPRGRAGNVTLPIRVAATRGGNVIYSQVFRHPVAITDVAGATQFILNVPDIPIEGGIDRGVQMTVGFDERNGR